MSLALHYPHLFNERTQPFTIPMFVHQLRNSEGGGTSIKSPSDRVSQLLHICRMHVVLDDNKNDISKLTISAKLLRLLKPYCESHHLLKVQQSKIQDHICSSEIWVLPSVDHLHMDEKVLNRPADQYQPLKVTTKYL